MDLAKQTLQPVMKVTARHAGAAWLGLAPAPVPEEEPETPAAAVQAEAPVVVSVKGGEFAYMNMRVKEALRLLTYPNRLMVTETLP